MILFLFLIYISYSQTTIYSSNYILNNNFDIIADGISINSNNFQVINYLPQWNCNPTCQIQKCSDAIQNCVGNMVFMNNNIANNQMSQCRNYESGNYIFRFSLLPFRIGITNPYFYYSKLNIKLTLSHYLYYTINKTRYIYTGVIQYHQINFTIASTNQYLCFKIQLNNQDSSFHQPIGLNFNNISLQRYYIQLSNSNDKPIKNQKQQLNFIVGFNNAINNQLTKMMIKIPSLQYIFNQILSSYVHLQRLQFYYFRNVNYSQTSFLIINSTFKNMFQIKGQFLLQFLAVSQIQTISQNLQYINYKQQFNKENQNVHHVGYFSFYQYCIQSLLLNFIFNIIIYFCMLLAFRILFKYKLSKLIRRFSFGISLYLIFLQGYVKTISFFAFSQFSTFFSINYKHKLLNVFIIFLFFIFCIFSVGLFYISRFIYGKLSKYFTKSYNLKPFQLWILTFNQILVLILDGAIHQLILSNSNIQLIILNLIEIINLIMIIYCLKNNTKLQKSQLYFLIIQSFIRILLQISLYLYQNHLYSLQFINNYVHMVIIIMIFSFSCLEFIYNLISSIVQLKYLFHNKVIDKQIKNNNKNNNKNPQPMKSIKGVLFPYKYKKSKIKNQTQNRPRNHLIIFKLHTKQK